MENMTAKKTGQEHAVPKHLQADGTTLHVRCLEPHPWQGASFVIAKALPRWRAAQRNELIEIELQGITEDRMTATAVVQCVDRGSPRSITERGSTVVDIRS